LVTVKLKSSFAANPDVARITARNAAASQVFIFTPMSPQE
jgi:hypothetical protein